jgi:hypothetical protein
LERVSKKDKVSQASKLPSSLALVGNLPSKSSTVVLDVAIAKDEVQIIGDLIHKCLRLALNLISWRQFDVDFGEKFRQYNVQFLEGKLLPYE